MDTTGLPKTRAAAKAAGAKYYFTGEPCKQGHIAQRKTKGVCVECMKEGWRAAAPRRAEYFAAYNKSEAGLECKDRYYQKNKEVVIAKARSTPNELKNAYRARWREENVDWVRADTKARRRKHREATPPWLTARQKSEIRNLYVIAITMSKTTGERYVVDHIVPLRSEVVCGLHVPWNLRVITQEENLAKSNRHVV